MDPTSFAAPPAEVFAILPKPMRAPVPSEHDEQALVVKWADAHPAGDPRRLLLAIPNGGERNKIVAAKLKAEGVRKGVPDLFLPVAWETARRSPVGFIQEIACGLWIEMKRRGASPSAVTPEQRAWHEALRAQGYRVAVCRGADEAIATIDDYLGCPA